MAQGEMDFLFNNVIFNNSNLGEIYSLGYISNTTNYQGINGANPVRYRYNDDFYDKTTVLPYKSKTAFLGYNTPKNITTNNEGTEDNKKSYPSNFSPGTTGIKNQIKGNVYYNDTSNGNPYSKVINQFKNVNSLKILPSDIAYCKDLGVHPVNKMFVLRRFNQGVSVPINLYDIQNIEPISIVVFS